MRDDDGDRKQTSSDVDETIRRREVKCTSSPAEEGRGVPWLNSCSMKLYQDQRAEGPSTSKKNPVHIRGGSDDMRLAAGNHGSSWSSKLVHG